LISAGATVSISGVLNGRCELLASATRQGHVTLFQFEVLVSVSLKLRTLPSVLLLHRPKSMIFTSCLHKAHQHIPQNFH
jgi:hypothetical protein